MATTVLLAATAAALPAAATPPSAPLKLRLCQPCTLPAAPMDLPRHGVVFVRASFIGTGSLWYIADFERQEAARIEASIDRETGKLRVVERLARPLQGEDLALVSAIAQRIWASERPLPTQMVTDVVWDLWLLDGADARHEFAPGLPAGLASEFQEALARIVTAPR